jgi:hypothetical protein
MRPKSFFPVLMSFLFLLIYCEQNNNPTQPKESLQPGARNYVWQLDTLDMPVNYISSIWGASPENVARMIGLAEAEYFRLKPGLQ